MLQPTQFDVVLGGKSNQPKAYDVVLGGKQSVENAIKALKNPNTYEQAKKVLLVQPKKENPLLEVKARSWDDIFRFYSEHIEIYVEKPEGYERYYGYDFPVAYYYFTIPEVIDNPLTYHITPYGKELDIGNRACFKSEKWICSRLSQASNFRYLTDRWGYHSKQILIGNYWDADRQKMILLP